MIQGGVELNNNGSATPDTRADIGLYVDDRFPVLMSSAFLENVHKSVVSNYPQNVLFVPVKVVFLDIGQGFSDESHVFIVDATLSRLSVSFRCHFFKGKSCSGHVSGSGSPITSSNLVVFNCFLIQVFRRDKPKNTAGLSLGRRVASIPSRFEIESAKRSHIVLLPAPHYILEILVNGLKAELFGVSNANEGVLLSGIALDYNIWFVFFEEYSVWKDDLAPLILVTDREKIQHQPIKVHALALIHGIDNFGCPLCMLVLLADRGFSNCRTSLIIRSEGVV